MECGLTLHANCKPEIRHDECVSLTPSTTTALPIGCLRRLPKGREKKMGWNAVPVRLVPNLRCVLWEECVSCRARECGRERAAGFVPDKNVSRTSRNAGWWFVALKNVSWVVALEALGRISTANTQTVRNVFFACKEGGVVVGKWGFLPWSAAPSAFAACQNVWRLGCRLGVWLGKQEAGLHTNTR